MLLVPQNLIYLFVYLWFNNLFRQCPANVYVLTTMIYSQNVVIPQLHSRASILLQDTKLIQTMVILHFTIETLVLSYWPTVTRTLTSQVSQH